MASRKPQFTQTPAGDRNSLIVLAGAQLLATQQTIKTFLLTLKTRDLTDREKADFAKTRSLLESALQQRLQATPTTNPEAGPSMKFNLKEANQSPGASFQHQPKPLQPLSALRPPVPPNRSTQSSSQNTKKSSILQPSMLNLPHSQKAYQSSSTKRSASSKSNLSKPINPKLEIYRDPENVASPVPAYSSSSRNVQELRGKITFVNNEINSPAGKVPKGVLAEKTLNNPNTSFAARQETLLHNPKEANQQKAYDSITFTHLGRPNQPKNQQRTQQATRLPPTPKKRPFNDENQIYPSKHIATTPFVAKTICVQTLGTRIEERPLTISESPRKPVEESAVDFQYLNRKLAETPQDESKANVGGHQQPTTPSVSSPSHSEIEVLASFEDEGTSTSLDELLARHKVKDEPLSQKRSTAHEAVSTKDIDEIEDSQGSQKSDAHDTINLHVTTESHSQHSQHSQHSLLTTIDTFDSLSHDFEDETAPQPGFLLENVPEPEEPVAAEVDEIEGSQEETLARPDFPEDLPEHGHVSEIEDDSDSDGYVSFPHSDVSRRGSTNSDADLDSLVRQSTDCVANVWCIDNFCNVILSVVYGHGDSWIAIETRHRVQLWQLESTSEGKWVKRSQYFKTSSHYTQVLFSQDDSYALMIDYTQKRYTKVPLTTSGAVGSMAWRSVPPNDKLDAFIRLDAQGDDSIVMGTEEAGTLLRVHVAKDIESSPACIPAKQLYYAGANDVAGSICAVQNTRSLVAAVFGQEIALWDVSGLQNTPITVINTSIADIPSVMDIISASVPRLFTQEYAEMIHSGALPPSQWPILAVIRMSDLDNSTLDQDHDQCGLYVMREKAIQLVHKYRGTRNISSVSCSSRYVACHVKPEGKDILRLWDIVHPEPALAMSLVDPSLVTCKKGYRLSRDPAKVAEAETERLKKKTLESEEQEESNDTEDDNSLSSCSLSLPPSDMSWSQENSSGNQNLPGIPPREVLDSDSSVTESSSSSSTPRPRLPHATSQGRDDARPRKEWIELESVAWEEQKVLFSLHPNQRRVVVVQQDRRSGKIAASPMASSTSSVHVMDLESLLPNAYAN